MLLRFGVSHIVKPLSHTGATVGHSCHHVTADNDVFKPLWHNGATVGHFCHHVTTDNDVFKPLWHNGATVGHSCHLNVTADNDLLLSILSSSGFAFQQS